MQTLTLPLGLPPESLSVTCSTMLEILNSIVSPSFLTRLSSQLVLQILVSSCQHTTAYFKGEARQDKTFYSNKRALRSTSHTIRHEKTTYVATRLHLSLLAWSFQALGMPCRPMQVQTLISPSLKQILKKQNDTHRTSRTLLTWLILRFLVQLVPFFDQYMVLNLMNFETTASHKMRENEEKLYC